MRPAAALLVLIAASAAHADPPPGPDDPIVTLTVDRFELTDREPLTGTIRIVAAAESVRCLTDLTLTLSVDPHDTTGGAFALVSERRALPSLQDGFVELPFTLKAPPEAERCAGGPLGRVRPGPHWLVATLSSPHPWQPRSRDNWGWAGIVRSPPVGVAVRQTPGASSRVSALAACAVRDESARDALLQLCLELGATDVTWPPLEGIAARVTTTCDDSQAPWIRAARGGQELVVEGGPAHASIGIPGFLLAGPGVTTPARLPTNPGLYRVWCWSSGRTIGWVVIDGRTRPRFPRLR